MNFRQTFAVTALALAAFGTTEASAATNLLVNGGFEANDAITSSSSYYNIGTQPGSNGAGPDHAVPAGFGWTVSNGNVDIISYGSYPPAPNTNSGLSGLDLVGYGSAGEISQNLNTVAGRAYTVSFDYKNNPGVAAPTADVLVNGSAIDSVTGTGSFQTYNGTFIGTGSPVSFALNETSGSNNGGVFLDNVTITAVPEPAVWAMLLLGFFGIGYMVRGTRKEVVPTVA